MTSKKSCVFPVLVFLKSKSKMAADCHVFKFLQRSVDGKHLMRFQSAKRRFQISPAWYGRGLNKTEGT